MSIKKTIKDVVEENKEGLMFFGFITTTGVALQVVGYALVKIINKVVK